MVSEVGSSVDHKCCSRRGKTQPINISEHPLSRLKDGGGKSPARDCGNELANLEPAKPHCPSSALKMLQILENTRVMSLWKRHFKWTTRHVAVSQANLHAKRRQII